MVTPMRVSVSNTVIQWAIKNGEKSETELMKKYDLHAWENPTSTRDYPTFKQIQNFSHDTRIPVNYFFKQTLPQEEHTFAKFRTINNTNIQPSRRLIETIQVMESYQAWMKDFLLNQDKAIKFQLLASVKATMNVDKVAQQIIEILHLENLAATKLTDDDFFNLLRSKLSNAGVMVMQSGIVGTNPHRPLDINEFRAFVLVDNVIPLIFINSTDSKKAKIFSLIHEFVHILLGDNEILNVSPETEIHQERWINQITSAVLMPLKEIKAALSTSLNHQANLVHLSQLFHTSLVATAIRLKLLGQKPSKKTN